jgi:hypothetical protein
MGSERVRRRTPDDADDRQFLRDVAREAAARDPPSPP